MTHAPETGAGKWSRFTAPVSEACVTGIKGKKVKADIALNDTPSQSYGTSLAIWDHTVLPATRHK